MGFLTTDEIKEHFYQCYNEANRDIEILKKRYKDDRETSVLLQNIQEKIELLKMFN